MISWDLILTIVIIVAAAFYLVRKFSRSKKGGACGCGPEGGCCGGGDHSGGASRHCEDRHP